MTKMPSLLKILWEWANWFESAKRAKLNVVGQDTLPDGTFVSTVFLGLDHNFFDSGIPILFETMAFNRGKKGLDMSGTHQWRYATWKEARRGHIKAITIILGEKATAYIEKYDLKFE
jgi:hypothetical protein